MATKFNPSAFPVPWRSAEGMTLLDYFAARALSGPVSALMTAQLQRGDTPSSYDDCARMSYAVARAMLKERERLQQEEKARLEKEATGV